MISSLIQFAKLQGTGSVSISAKERKNKVVIVRTEETTDGLRFSGSALLDDTQLVSFIKSVPDLELPADANAFKNVLIKQINLRSINKRLGSTSGLMSSIPYAFSLSEKNVAHFVEKAEETKSPKEGWVSFPELQNHITNALVPIYLDFWKQNSITPKEDLFDALVFILLPAHIQNVARKAIYSSFVQDRRKEWENSENLSEAEMRCPVCGELGRLGVIAGDTYQAKKPFSKRRGRKDAIGFRVCAQCSSDYSEALSFIKSAGFRIFPIFEATSSSSGMSFLDESGKAKSFKRIFEELPPQSNAPVRGASVYNFQLIAVSLGEIWLCDYVTGYSPFFSNTSVTYSRFQAERDFWNILGVQKFYPYFEDSKSLFGAVKGFSDSVKLKVFDLVYRGDDNALSKEDVAKALDLSLRRELVESKNPCASCSAKIQSVLRLFTVLRCMTMEVPKEDQEKAKLLGKAFRLVTDLSEAGNKHTLLSLALDKPKMDGVKSVLARLLDKFHHKFSELDKDDQQLISNSLSATYSVDRFDSLKPYFYAGYFEVK